MTPNKGTAETQIFADCTKSELTFSSLEYEIKTGLYNSENVVFKFPNISKYYPFRNRLNIVNVKNLKLHGRTLKFDLSIKKDNQSKIITEGVEFTFSKQKRTINKAAILNLFKKNTPETFWQELWKHYEKLLQKDHKRN